MRKNIFNKRDIRQIKAEGIDLRDVEKELGYYRRGAAYLRLDRPCSAGDGIICPGLKEQKRLIERYESEAAEYGVIKFVPASGAASRMFAGWFAALEKGGFGPAEKNREFLQKLKKLPFFPLMEKNKTGRELLEKKDVCGIIRFILGKDGLNYGNLPKALIPFHLYPGGIMHTPLDEHLAEAAEYTSSAEGIIRLHFTLSAEHKSAVNGRLREIIAEYENIRGKKYAVSLSEQSAATNTIAADEENKPLRDTRGRLVFRPGGHGTLIKNLNALDADLIFIRNIDNIAPEALFRKAVPFRKMLGGMAIGIQRENFSLLRELKENEMNSRRLAEIAAYCTRILNIIFPSGFRRLDRKEKIRMIFSLLNRPLRICGMVRNDGEPGGGPFWVKEADGRQTLQIVEGAHVNKDDAVQQSIWSKAKYFNPVDMVCCTRDYRGKKFVLDKYVDKSAYLITGKNEKGVTFRALEVPGLWNGGMAYWNTVFVELPLFVFNPVKTVYDLLRPEHGKT